ncbi:PRC-barrel domain-containing protein [Phenylobacterium sp.]|uniref:PRC-barrel domain-containing protein n=1 Tax=Phenylobacterium sp. TaxID=1871053 RepID=UPI00286DC964|nr:PRC-barrel domain-containing protein [Phenylobacterium sp.]
MIKPRYLLAAGVAAGLMFAFANLASAQGASLEGREVRAADGVVLGTITKVIVGADGGPLQILVQPKGARPTGPRSLPYKALSADGDRFVIPLSKAEFDSMPAVDLAAK